MTSRRDETGWTPAVLQKSVTCDLWSRIGDTQQRKLRLSTMTKLTKGRLFPHSALGAFDCVREIVFIECAIQICGNVYELFRREWNEFRELIFLVSRKEIFKRIAQMLVIRLAWMVYEFMMTFPFGVYISTTRYLNLCLFPTRHIQKLSVEIFRKSSSIDMCPKRRCSSDTRDRESNHPVLETTHICIWLRVSH